MITNPSSMSVGFLAVFRGYVKDYFFWSERGFTDLVFSLVLSMLVYWVPGNEADYDA